MTLLEIQTKLRAAKDSILQAARIQREGGNPVFAMAGAVMPDGSIKTWGFGPMSPEQMLAAAQGASVTLRRIGAAGGFLAADGYYQADDAMGVGVEDPLTDEDAKEMGLETRALLVFLTAPGWDEAWSWIYEMDAESGVVEWHGPPETTHLLSSHLGFAPFGQRGPTGIIH